MQNVKHAKKTAKNQIYYGTRLLTFGNSTVRYDQLCNLAKKENSALRIRDVYNVNKQDDSAAFRIFHSQLLRMSIDSDKLSLFVYLFILGELFDAYLNCKISHKTRIIIAMHAYFFLDFWKSHIEKTGKNISNKWYSVARSFISI
ncbi:hypothetical protein RhiirA5_303446 [Rhizophagus irregularis]|uniref:Uncharacterized protein n=1 Tax=Rhizophagus irregularis TaxID=588596 RepID=A0A2I1FIV1_9GLOM|nr:hypothetical protein RhiirA5_303446 [Rhizophagus irregularis]PKC56645.1 hypothetical protein RhiirA1_353638 [Rhizophagus irregularis]PKY34304.1 hypothetical protein RhiirB3_344709 [Rhizophagus irregularis]